MSARRPLLQRAVAAWGSVALVALSTGCTYAVYRGGDGRFLEVPFDWRPGVTTAREVASALGPPDHVRQEGARMTFVYRFQRRAETRLALTFYLKLFQRAVEREADGTLLVAFDANDRLLYHGSSELPPEDLADDLGLR
jgi:hypothetical protein